MKSIILCLTLTLILKASGEEWEGNTVEDLLSAQDELTVGHEFAESLFQVDRNIISSYISIVQVQILDSFMDTYSEMHMIADETTQAFNDLTAENSCINAARNRWSIQIPRYGQKLSECLLNSVLEVRQWNNFVNNLHWDTEDITNQIPNAGVVALTEREEFTARDRLGGYINTRFMQLLRRARPYLEIYEDFRASVVENEEEIIEQLTECDRRLAHAFSVEARDDLERATNCE